MVRNPALCAWIIKAAFNNKHMHVYVYAPLLSRFSHVRLSNPMDHSSLGFSVPGIFQARILEWLAISFCICVCVCVCIDREREKETAVFLW